MRRTEARRAGTRGSASGFGRRARDFRALGERLDSHSRSSGSRLLGPVPTSGSRCSTACWAEGAVGRRGSSWGAQAIRLEGGARAGGTRCAVPSPMRSARQVGCRATTFALRRFRGRLGRDCGASSCVYGLRSSSRSECQASTGWPSSASRTRDRTAPLTPRSAFPLRPEG